MFSTGTLVSDTVRQQVPGRSSPFGKAHHCIQVNNHYFDNDFILDVLDVHTCTLSHKDIMFFSTFQSSESY